MMDDVKCATIYAANQLMHESCYGKKGLNNLCDGLYRASQYVIKGPHKSFLSMQRTDITN